MTAFFLFLLGAAVSGYAARENSRSGGAGVREFAKAFYKSKAWENTRESYALSVGWLCEDCLAKGLVVPGKVVHHKIPLSPQNIDDPRITLDWSNLKLVCQDCHAKEHRKNSGRRWTVDDYGKVIAPLA